VSRIASLARTLIPGIVEHRKEDPISLSRPAVEIRCFEDRLHLVARKKPQHRPIEALHRYCHGLLNRLECGDVVARGILQKRSNCGQAGIASASGVLAHLLEVSEEGQNELGIYVGEMDPRWWFTGGLFRDWANPLPDPITKKCSPALPVNRSRNLP
jgi:hypothetical protein